MPPSSPLEPGCCSATTSPTAGCPLGAWTFPSTLRAAPGWPFSVRLLSSSSLSARSALCHTPRRNGRTTSSRSTRPCAVPCSTSSCPQSPAACSVWLCCCRVTMASPPPLCWSSTAWPLSTAPTTPPLLLPLHHLFHRSAGLWRASPRHHRLFPHQSRHPLLVPRLRPLAHRIRHLLHPQ